MTEVISVRFKNKGKVYYFDPNGVTVVQGESVIVETAKGLEFAECVSGNHQVEDETVHPPLRPVIRAATPEDIRRAEENHAREKEAFEVCRQQIARHGLEMKLVDVEYNFEGTKILFFFTSEGRVDFRELVRDLAGIFRTRIELRQIGVRDEARMLGGLGICGRPFCCAQFLEDFQPVSIKMAKTQGLSLNPAKISGACGRLMCCLKYEQDAYEELVQNVPKVDAFVDTPAGKGSVVDVNLLKGTVRVRLEDQSDMAMRTFEAGEVTVLGGKAKRAEYLALKAEGKLPEQPARPAPQRLRKSLENRPAGEPKEDEDTARRSDNRRQQHKSRQRPDTKKQKLDQTQKPRQEQQSPKPRQEQQPQKEQRPRSEPQKTAQKPVEETEGSTQKSQERKPSNRRRYYRPRRPNNNGQSQPKGE